MLYEKIAKNLWPDDNKCHERNAMKRGQKQNENKLVEAFESLMRFILLCDSNKREKTMSMGFLFRICWKIASRS